MVQGEVSDADLIVGLRGDLTSCTKSTLAELSNMLDGKNVIGQPIQAGETTVIPMLNLGFGFGVVTGSGGGKDKGQIGTGFGGAIGGGGGVRPVAMLVIDKDGGVRMLAAPGASKGNGGEG